MAFSTCNGIVAEDHPWWKDVVCYQVWPMSFKDSNDDGIGDIQGVISKLDYLQDLGIDVVWICPTYASPLKDYGYDISDWQAICPTFGTMQDMEDLIEQVHKRSMRILMDLVVTHTSDQHAWFKESRSSKTNDKHDWYIWKDARKGNKIWNPVTFTHDEVTEPNNWCACFGGSAWTYVPERDQYYLTLFMPSEPDLNWELKHVREAIFKDAVGFWLDKGIDGFRIDTVNRISKDQTFPDAPRVLEGRLQPGSDYYINGPRSHEYLKYLREYINDHPRVKERGQPLMLVGELPRTEYDDVLKYVHPELKELSMVFDFDMVKLGGHDDPDNVKAHEVKNLCDGDPAFTLPLFKQRIKKVQDLIASGAWGTVFMENHDQCRSINRYATPDMKYRDQAAKLLCILQTTLSGTQFVYQGQEIAMTDMPGDWDIDDFRDQGAGNYMLSYQAAEAAKHGREAGLNAREAARRGNLKFGRDNGRTLVQWTSGKNAGFSDTEGKCWIGVHHNYKEINVEDQQKDPNSIWHFWKNQVRLRKRFRSVLMHGSFEILDPDNENSFTYVKRSEDGFTVLVCLNFSEEKERIWIPQHVERDVHFHYISGNYGSPVQVFSPLRAWEGRVYLANSAGLEEDEQDPT